MLHVYSCKVENVVDGDTIDVAINQGFGNIKRTRLRFLEVDTPEKNTSNKLEKIHGLAATAYLTDLLLDKEVYIRTMKKRDGSDKTGKYGRYLAYVYLTLEDLLKDLNIKNAFEHDAITTQNSVNVRLITEGFAKKDSY